MSKSVTVQFDDGSSHVYEDVPDDINDQDIKDRAFTDYAKNVTGVTYTPVAELETKKTSAVNEGPVAPSMTEKIVAGAQVPLQLAAQHPGAIAGAAGLYKANQVANKYLAGKELENAAKMAELNKYYESFGQGGGTPSSSAPTTKPLGTVDYATKLVKSLALSKLLPAAQVGTGLFYTSPEEIATLKAAEEKRKQQGLRF